MSDNKVQITISAQDLASAVIKGINDALDEAGDDVKQLANDMEDAGSKGVNSLGSLLTPLRQIPLAFNQTVEMAQRLWQGLMSLAEPAMVMDKLNTQFKAASGSAQTAARDLQFVREISASLGLSFTESAAGFAKFSASVRGTSIEGEQARKVFTGVAEASTALRLSADETNGILLAFSQMMGKGRISAEELNQVGERLPGALDVMAKSMSMTTTEFRKAAEEGRILSAELMTNVGPALSSLYGAAAQEAANSPVAQLNRMKNALFELAAAIGAGPMQAVGNLAAAFTNLAEGAKSGLAWLMQPATGGGSAAFAEGLRTIAAAVTAVVAGLAVAAGGYAAYSAATAFATTATGAFTASLLANPLFLAGALALAGVVAAITAVGKAFDNTAESAEKAGKASAEATEAQRRQAAETKRLQDEYDKAFGADLDRQLAKRAAQYEQDRQMLDDKLTIDLQQTGLTEEQKTALATKHQQDRRKLGELYYQDVNKMRDDDQKKERAAYDARLNDHRDYLQALGKAEEADNFEFARKLQRERDNLLEHFARKEADAKANGLVLVGLEAEKQAAIEELQRLQSAAAERRGLDRVQKDIEAAKKAADAQIAEIKRKEAAGILSAQQSATEILLIEQGLLRQQLELAKGRANTWTPDTEQHKKALGEIAAAEAVLTNNLAAQAKQRETERKTNYSERVENLKLAMQGELLAVQDGETAKTVSTQEGVRRRLDIERDFAEQMAALRAQELDSVRDRSETDVKEYQAALSAKLEADKAYLTAKQKINEHEAKQLAQLTERAAQEIKARAEQERAALVQSEEFAAGWFSIWDAAYSKATRSLQELSVAAYNSFAEMQGMPLKSIDTLENLRKKADEAAAEFGRLHEQSRLTALTTSAAWAQAYSDLIKVSASAAKITEEFYLQAVAAEELAEALELPANSTEQFVWQAERALQQMKLLDNSSLDKLRAGIKRIKDEMAAFTERVIDGLKSLQDEWDNMTMSKMQLEEKRYQEQRLEWQKDYDNAQKQGNAQALAMLNEQLKLIEKIHKAKSAELSLDPDNSIAPIKRALGGWVPGTGNADTVPAMLTPGEYVIRQSASSFWGNGILTAINNPFSKWGQELQARIAGISAALPQTPLTPRLAFATGGPVAPVAVTSAQAPISLVINTTEQIDADLIRRKIIPELERYQRRTK